VAREAAPGAGRLDTRSGVKAAADAARFAAVLAASSEGAVVLARAEQSLEPFDLVTEQLLEQVRVLGRAGETR
jgi:TetR/AcrR family transcriptional repressor of lmrAB and yxaGH operons